MNRCAWALCDPLMVRYHDEEWGVPVHDDRIHYAFIVLDGAQAGLSWLTVLRKREGYRALFADFDPARVAAFTEADVDRLVEDPRIIRNRSKIVAAIHNARSFIEIQEEEGSFDAFIWRFVGGQRINNEPRAAGDVPTRSPEAEAMSKALQRRGFRFVGPTICYAYMQAAGMVNDHVIDCFRRDQV